MIECILGSKEDFFNFLKKITSEDKVAILTHNDLDGIASAILLEEILKGKGIELFYLNFLNYKKDMFYEVILKLEEKGIKKVFLTDIAADTDLQGFSDLRKKFDTFLIDHHPINPDLINKQNIIKTHSYDCATFIVYNLGKGIIDLKKWDFLVCATMISEISYKKKENLEFIQKIYPEIKKEGIFESTLGEFAKKISSALIYFNSDLKKVYDFILNGDFQEIERAHTIVQKEIELYIEKFEKEAEFFPEKNLHFYYARPKFNIASIVLTKISFKSLEKIYIFISDINAYFVGVSSRHQGGQRDMGALLKKGIEGLENATGGGHAPAAGARFMKKDLEKFKKNILR